MRCRGAHLEVMLALGADVQVGFEIGLADRLAAAEALDPQAVGADPAFGASAVRARWPGLVFAILSLEPGHRHSSLDREQ